MRVLVRVRGTAPAGESVLVTEGARGEHVMLSRFQSRHFARMKGSRWASDLSALHFVKTAK